MLNAGIPAKKWIQNLACSHHIGLHCRPMWYVGVCCRPYSIHHLKISKLLHRLDYCLKLIQSFMNLAKRVSRMEKTTVKMKTHCGCRFSCFCCRVHINSDYSSSFQTTNLYWLPNLAIFKIPVARNARNRSSVT